MFGKAACFIVLNIRTAVGQPWNSITLLKVCEKDRGQDFLIELQSWKNVPTGAKCGLNYPSRYFGGGRNGPAHSATTTSSQLHT
jgi:hypothetical protein